MGKLKGKDLIIAIGGISIAASRSCTFTLQCDTIEKAAPGDGTYKNYIAGRKSWSCSADCFLLDNNFISAAQLVGQTVSMSCEATQDYVITGNAIITQAVFSGAVNELATVAFSFQGTGDLNFD